MREDDHLIGKSPGLAGRSIRITYRQRQHPAPVVAQVDRQGRSLAARRARQTSRVGRRSSWFELGPDADVDCVTSRKEALLANTNVLSRYLGDLCTNTGTGTFLGAVSNFALLAGTRPDLYSAFVCQVWSHMHSEATAGMLHPDTHFGGTKDGPLRAAAYTHLRLHSSFVNAANWAFPPPVGRNIEFGVHIYGATKDPKFLHLSRLYDARPLIESLTHDGSGDPPGQKFQRRWDNRPHSSRLILVDNGVLSVAQAYQTTRQFHCFITSSSSLSLPTSRTRLAPW